MPHSPLVSKIRCHHPNKQKSRVCNRNYLVYIATREGVDLSDITYLKIEQQLEELNDTNVSIESAYDLYAKYIAERPGSHGLFGNFDITNVNTVANHLADLTSSGKTIYRGIVSLSEKDAKELGYIGDTAKDKWVQFMRASMPDISKQFNIPIDKLKWTAAVHMEKNHPHCHYMFWHDGEAITNPYIHTSVQNACREILSKEMFKEEREQEQINKTLHRDLLLDTGHKLLETETTSIMEYVNTANRSLIMGRISNDTLHYFGNKLLLLSAQLPTSGRLNYQLLPPETKIEVDNFIDELLQEKELNKEYLSYLQTADNISRTYSVSEKHFNINHKKADEDMRKRLANTVLKSCRYLTREMRIFDKYIDRAELLSCGSLNITENMIKHYENEAAAGNPQAQGKLGNMYLWGKNPLIKQNTEKGIELLKAAAAQGNEYAKTSLDIYQDIHNSTGNNLIIKTGYTCLRSAFSILTQHRRSPDPYADPAIRNIGKAARKALATRMGKYVDQNNKKE